MGLTVIVCDKFKVVRQALNVGVVEVKDVKIDVRKLYLGKILDGDKRRKLPMVASRQKLMRGFENVYLLNDSTFRQRQELSERRRRVIMTDFDSGVLGRVNEGGTRRLRLLLMQR